MRIFRRGFRKEFVGSESDSDYFNIQKSWCMVWWVVVVVLMVCFGCGFDWEIFDCLSWLFVWLILRWIDEIVFRVCFLVVFDWMVVGIVFSDCLIWLIVPVGCFLLNGCDFVRKKKNYGRTVHCKVAVVKPCVKKSAVWFKRLIFWFGSVLFVVKTLLCSEHRFANDEKDNRLPNSDGYCSCVEENAAGCSALF